MGVMISHQQRKPSNQRKKEFLNCPSFLPPKNIFLAFSSKRFKIRDKEKIRWRFEMRQWKSKWFHSPVDSKWSFQFGRRLLGWLGGSTGKPWLGLLFCIFLIPISQRLKMTVEKTLEQLPPAQVLNPRCLAFELFKDNYVIPLGFEPQMTGFRSQGLQNIMVWPPNHPNYM